MTEGLQRRARDEDGTSILVPQDMSYNEWYNKNVDNQGKIGYNVNYIRKNQYTKNKNLDSEIKKAIKLVPNEIQELLNNTGIKTTKKNSYYDRDNDIIYLLPDSDKYEVLHEIGHVVETKMDLMRSDRYISLQSRQMKNINPIYDLEHIDGYEVIYNGKKEKVDFVKDTGKFISEYQRTIYDEDIDNNPRILDNYEFNPRTLGEYFSEGFRCYYQSNNLLRRKDIELYNYIKEILHE